MNMKMNFSMDEIRLKVEEYIKKGSRAAGRPVLTAYYVLTADSTPESERTNIMIALVAIVFPAGIEDLLGQVFMVGKGFAAIYAYKKMKKYITPQIKDKVEFISGICICANQHNLRDGLFIVFCSRSVWPDISVPVHHRILSIDKPIICSMRKHTRQPAKSAPT